MKILQVHNYYKYSGGEDKVVEDEKLLLESNYHQVIQFTKDNRSIMGLKEKLSLLTSTHYSSKSKKEFKEVLYKCNPDLVHVHNFFPLITPSIYDECIDINIPIVQTLHNYRLIHPNGLLMNNGKIDERSVLGSAYNCIFDAVYRKSRLQTAVVAHMIEYHRKKKTWFNKIDKFIALSNFAKSKFIEGGLPAEKISVKPNFLHDFYDRIKMEHFDKPSFVYIGRLSEEKGITELIKSWVSFKIPFNLFVFGTGPLENELRKIAHNHSAIKWMGFQSNQIFLKYIKSANALIFPSTCYENFPISILEAFSMGTPIISSKIGSHGSIIEDFYNGLHYKVGDNYDLKEKIFYLAQNEHIAKKMGLNARLTYQKYYTPEENYKQLINLYLKTLSGKVNNVEHIPHLIPA